MSAPGIYFLTKWGAPATVPDGMPQGDAYTIEVAIMGNHWEFACVGLPALRAWVRWMRHVGIRRCNLVPFPSEEPCHFLADTTIPFPTDFTMPRVDVKP